MADEKTMAGVAEAVEGLAEEFGEEHSLDVIREVVEQAAQQYADARIKMYVPIIAKRFARARLVAAKKR